MSTQSLIQILEICLEQVEAGRSLEETLAAQPEHAEELRPLLEIALEAKQGDQRAPTAARISSRQKMLAKAEQLQRQRSSAAFWRGLYFLRRHAGSLAFGIAAVCLLFIALNSVSALPGDSLYPVKIAAEQASVSLANSPAAREEREVAFDNNRAEEVQRLIDMNRTGSVSFGGYLRSGQQDHWQAAGIPLQLTPEQKILAQYLTGVYVEIKGDLERPGQVVVASLVPHLDTINGTVTSLEPDGIMVGSQMILVTKASRIIGVPAVGSQVTVQAARLENSAQMLAVTAEVVGSAPSATSTATPTAENTATPTLTASPQPSPTIQPTQAAQPTAVHEPEDNHNSPAQPTAEPEHQDHHNSDGSGDHGDGESGDN